MFQWLRGLFGGGGGTKAAERPRVQARYDNAVTTPENARNWIGADYLSAKSANSFGVRRTLRIRSRHEVSNNPFLFGITHSNADDLIDSGPTLQLYTSDAGYNRAVERAWAEWCAEVDLTEKLRATKLAKTVDGEGFLVLKTVEDLESPVKLYPCDLEADQVTTPAPVNLTDLWVDGLTLHPITGRPTAYHVLRSHPGDSFFPNLNPLAVDKIPARWVIHWFQRSRPGQVRGVPVFTPSLDLFGELRAFRKAVLTNAQIAAAFTGVLESEAPAQGDDSDAESEPFKRVPIDRGMMTTLPAGHKLNGFDPKQPQTTYEMFQEKCLGEACRPLNYPLNLALGTSQKFNFSSSKLDHINYRNGLTVERGQCSRAVLEPMFRAWFEEAVLCGAVPVWEGGLTPPPHEWHWPGFESIDPAADATADQTTLAGGQQTWREFWAKRGKDWRDVMAQQAAEQAEIERLGLEFGEPVKQTVSETEGEPANAA
jgi:lambda family phage portal protein